MNTLPRIQIAATFSAPRNVPRPAPKSDRLFRPLLCLLLAVGGWANSLAPLVEAAEFAIETQDDGLTVKQDGKLLTRYLVRSGAKPILWPLVGPTGKELTRGYPMREATSDERNDHVHHRSFWFTHGDVNGIDFWSENKGHGTIEHQEFLKVQGGGEAVIATRNLWKGPQGEPICEDRREFRFGVSGEMTHIDVELQVKALDKPVRFGDTKEGAFGVRVAGTMKVTSKLGGKIINSEGQLDKAAWGQPAAWVDYSGPVDGETVGIAILNHPSSFRYPTYWHVRDYGLFAANPFGLHHFKGDNSLDGSHTLQPGESFTLKYRVLLHRGDASSADIAAAFKEYAK